MPNPIITTNERYPLMPGLFKNPDRFPKVGYNILGNTPDRIDSFLLEKEDKFKLHLGFDIGDPLGLLRYELDANGNIDRFRFGFDGNMVLLGQVMENQVGFNNWPEQIKPADTQDVMIGLRFRMDNKSFEIYYTGTDGMVRFHDLKTGMDDHYVMHNGEFLNKIEEGKIIPVNLLTPFILERIAEQYTYRPEAGKNVPESQRYIPQKQGDKEDTLGQRNS